ncbi:MAG: hypothetical protein OXG47_03665 [bacterium]|nr:hypothetical protein [bacterium]MCY3926192.1 hypothetical protein [bacterium]
MRGRWADGIVPRRLTWVLKDRLAVCERPGGHGPNHRAVRRTEEIIWIRRNDFSLIVSLLAGPHNLHSYDEQEMPCLHMPLSDPPQAAEMLAVYEEVARRIEAGERLLLHHDRVDDTLGGFLAGFWLWTGRSKDVPSALYATERLLRRPMGRQGREAVMAFAVAGVTRPARKPMRIVGEAADEGDEGPVGDDGPGGEGGAPPGAP